ncbi:MAG: SDR family NAD(P)-dependent oxidoreductase [Micrococcales bacterium]|nr:SDR family NAD(P)-dependent oxidoreductase [Micrococcales bacterium]
MNPDVLLVGCGDLGTDIGQRLARRGHAVVGIRRRAELVPAPLIGLSADLTREVPRLPDLDLQYLVVALTARPRTCQAYRATYVEGLRRALQALADAGQQPSRAVLISSTGVYGDVPSETLSDEATPAQPKDGPTRMLLEAEELFTAGIPGGTVLRLSGLYGRGPSGLAARVQQGRITDPDRWTNRIHRDDAAAAVVHLLTLPEAPGRLYLGTDDEPALLREVAAYLADRLRAPTPPPVDLERGHGKRLSNARLRATGWVPAYPTFRDGYRDYPDS